jgi:hypothetical protein
MSALAPCQSKDPMHAQDPYDDSKIRGLAVHANLTTINHAVHAALAS